MPAKEKVKELFHLAEELEKWAKRPDADEGRWHAPPQAGSEEQH